MSTTPDDPTQDPTVLASAYLDDEVTPDERARVEASPELLAEVDQLRQVRALVAADVQPAPLSERESHLAAALDVFDQLSPTAGAASTPTPIGLRRARRARRTSSARSGERTRLVLGVAAGLVVLAGVGAVIRGVIVSGDADTDTADQADTPAAESPEGVGPSEAEIAEELQGQNTNDDLPEDVDASEVARDIDALEAPADEPAMAADADAEEPAEEPAEALAEEPADDDAAVATDEDVADDAGSAGSADIPAEEATAAGDAPPEVDVVEIVTPQDLADLAAPAAYAPEAPAGGDAELEFSEPPCAGEPPDGLGVDRLAEPAFFRGELLNIGVDIDTGLALAFRDDCTVALDALLPSEAEFLAASPTVPPTTEAP